MKRILIAMLAGISVFGAVLGFAAALNLTTDTLGAANATVAACQAGALNAAYAPTYSAGTPGYQVTTVTITGLAAGCYSKSYRITLSGAANASLGEATGTTPSSGTSFTAAFTVSAASVTGVSVVIEG